MCKWTDEQLKEFDAARKEMVSTLEKYLDGLREYKSEFYIPNRYLSHVMFKSVEDEIRLLCVPCVDDLSLGFIKSHTRKVQDIISALSCVYSLQKKALFYEYY